MQYGISALVRSAPALIVLALSGCGAPRALPPPQLASAPPQAQGAALQAPAVDFPADAWWQAYGDPGLSALIAEALAQSPDMAVAAARIRAADGMALQSGAGLAPQARIDASAGGTKQSENLGIPPAFVPKGVLDTGRIAATLGLNLDLWGKARAQLAAARGEAQAARADAAQARLTLAAAVALGWGDLARSQASLQLAEQTLDADRGIEALTQRRLTQGLDNRSDLELAKARRAGSERAAQAWRESEQVTRNRIAALLGAGPGRGDTLPAPALAAQAVPGLPADLAASLVGRRPDLVAARLRAEASSQRVRAARAAFFPDINLSAVVGLQSLGLDTLLQGGSSFANFGPALSLPLFSGGQLEGNYQAAGAGQDEAVARYNAAVIGAFHDVADALTQKRGALAQLDQARSGAAAAGEAARLAGMRYRAGLANLLQVLTAEDSARSARQAVAELEARAFQTDVMLVKALGGGYAAPAPAAETK